MLSIKYHKDLNHNFLILHSKVKEEEQNYEYKMISGNRIKHLLECKIQYVNEECSFYYEISSKQNLKTLFERKPIGYDEMLRLLENMKGALDELESFLLDSRCLMLMPEHIYMELETKQYFFLYYPCAEEEDKKEGLWEFAQFLVDRVEHEREEAVEMAYKIYESIQDEKFILPHILNMFRPPVIEAKETNLPHNIVEGREDSDEVNVDIWQEREEYYGEEIHSNVSQAESMNYLPAVGILSLMCSAAAAGVFSIGYFFTLSVEEKLASMVGMIALVILSAALFLFFIINVCKRRNQWKRKMENRAEGKGVTGQNWMRRDSGEKNGLSWNASERGKAERHGMESESAYMTRANVAYEEEYGNTVFLDTTSYKKENKLYGTNKGNKYHIDLDKLPCTIGKMAGSVDVVIKDSTISRIHAQLTNREGGIYVTDMNSMNGTFKNGLRLEPNETVLIEQGDELRFGRMTFCYR